MNLHKLCNFFLGDLEVDLGTAKDTPLLSRSTCEALMN
jgi:hypothetical protein